MTTTKIQTKFNTWIDFSFSSEQLPDNVIGYYFAVYPTTRKKWVVTLLGNSKIYPDQEPWFVATPFRPKKTFTLGDFVNIENPVDILRELLRSYLMIEKYKDSYLVKAQAIAIGPIPGDLEFIK